MNEPRRDSGFFQELGRRRVYRSAAAYAVFAWVAIQAGSIVFPEFGAPDWAMRALIIIFIAGFPPAMLLAWTLDFSAKGITRTPDSGYTRARGVWPKLAIAAMTTAMSAAALWWAWDDYIVQSVHRPGRADIKEQPVVAVREPRYMAGRAGEEWLGDGVATLIRSELAESQHVVVVSSAHWNGMISGLTSVEEISARALKSGVDYLVDGELFATPDGIVLTTRIEDLENGIEILSPRISGPDAAAIIGGVVQLSTEIKRALRIPHQERVGLFEADFAIANTEAYETYIAGLSYFTRFDYQEAENAFKHVLAVAPDYHVARFRLAQVYEATGRSDLALAALNQIPGDANLSKRLDLYVDGAKAYFAAQRDPKKAIEIYSELVELYPYEIEAGHLLAEAYWLDFQDAAAIDEFRRLTQIHPYDATALSALGERLLDVGELDEARATLEKLAAMSPDDPYTFTLLGNLALQQRDFETAAEQHEHALTLRPGFVASMLGLAQSRYLQGDVNAAESIWRSIVSDADEVIDYRIDAAFDLAGVLRGRGLFAESLDVLEEAMPLIREEGLRTAWALSVQGTTWLELGNPERAADLLDQSVAEAPEPRTRYLFARGMLEYRLGRLENLDATVSEIRLLSDTSNEADRTEDKAANYLAGLSALAKGNLERAAPLLRDSVEVPGYQYGTYRSGLALFYRAAGDAENAAAQAGEAAAAREAGDLRLDLEIDRARALLLQAEILTELGAVPDAKEQARRFLTWWRDADPKLPEITRAQAILNN
jgi:adenylate cyclase